MFLPWFKTFPISGKTPFRLPLGGVGLGMLALYLLFYVLYAEGPHSQTRLLREIVDWVVVLLLLGLYWQGHQALKAEVRPGLLKIVLFGLLFSGIAFFTPPFHSTDLYGYINRGWQQAHYGLNPYVFVIDDIPNWGQDPMIRDHWVNNPCPYGFLFAELARLVCQIGGGDWLRTAFLFKGFNVLAHSVIAGLVYLGARRLGFEHPERSLYLYFWNPLILVHHLINGHNDLLMGLLTTLGMFFAITGAWLAILPALVAATLTKYAAGVLLPVVLLFIFKNRGWKVTIISSALALLAVLLIGMPYLPEFQQFKFGAMENNATLTHNSLHAMIYHSIELLAQGFSGFSPDLTLLKTGLKGLLWGGFGLFLLLQMRLILKERSFPVSALLEKSLLIQFLLIAVVSSKFYAWYFGMFFPLALLLPEGHHLRRLVVVLSGCQLFSITLLGQAHVLNYLLLMLLPMIVLGRPGSQDQHQSASASRLLTR